VIIADRSTKLVGYSNPISPAQQAGVRRSPPSGKWPQWADNILFFNDFLTEEILI
jgi:hypothetical protein